MGVKSIPLPVSPTSGRRWRLATGAAALLIIALRIDHPSEGLGTPKAPFSDALGPWLWGGLHAVFHLQQIDFLHRPTAGLFWGSIIGAMGRIDAVPWVVATLFLIASAFFVYVLRDSATGTAYVAWLLLLGLAPAEVLWSLCPMTFNVDFAAFVFGVIGTMLVLAADAGIAYAAAGLSLGVAAAIRGPMMVGAPILLAILLPWRRALLAGIFFLIPIVTDVALQKEYGIPNNGKELFYCVYADRFHMWTPESHAEFLRTLPSTSEVARRYVEFIVTPEGMAVLRRNIVFELEDDYPIIVVFLILAAAGLRRRAPTAMFAAYLACSAFISLAGASYTGRFAGTFSFLLHLGVLLLVAGGPPACDRRCAASPRRCSCCSRSSTRPGGGGRARCDERIAPRWTDETRR
jgi:hypothetical protein